MEDIKLYTQIGIGIFIYAVLGLLALIVGAVIIYAVFGDAWLEATIFSFGVSILLYKLFSSK